MCNNIDSSCSVSHGNCSPKEMGGRWGVVVVKNNKKKASCGQSGASVSGIRLDCCLLCPTGTLFQSGDKEEVEIRGCSIWCCALICKHLLELYEKKGQDMREKINAVLLDYYLWDYARDHREDMKEIPFHRVRCIYY